MQNIYYISYIQNILWAITYRGIQKNDNVKDALKKAAELTKKTESSIVGDAVEEKLDSMGLLGENEKQNLWEMLSELLREGVEHKKIETAFESLMERKVCDG